MKALMIFGSVIGFIIAVAIGLASGSSWANILWRACVAALVVAILFRWWAKVWFTNLQDSLHQRRNHGRSSSPDAKPTR